MDFLIYGRFDVTKKDNNQKTWINPNGAGKWEFNNTDVEIDLDIVGNLFISGFPPSDLIKNLENLDNERI